MMFNNWKLFFILTAFVFFSGNVFALSSDIGDSYKQKETIIGKLSGDVLQNIKKEQVKLLRSNVPVAFDYDIKNIGGTHYIWLVAPQNQENYTLIIEDIFENTLNGPQVIDYQKTFSVTNQLTEYNVKPGFVSTVSDFEIQANVFSGMDKQVTVDFPEPRSLILRPGVNSVEFSIENVNGAQFKIISFGSYEIPAYILGQDSSICGDNVIQDNEVCECGEDNVCGNEDDQLNGHSCASKEFESGNLSCSQDCLNFNIEQCVIDEYEGDKNNQTEEGKNNQSVQNNQTNSSSDEEKRFRIDPGLIRSKILFGENEFIYKFRIFNSGNETISDLVFDYDKNRFLIIPEENFKIESNESLEFELKLLNPTREGVRGVIIADTGFGSEFLMVSVTFTENESEVLTEYFRENVGEASNYYCSELSGEICNNEDVCSGEEVSSLDGLCCLSSCSGSRGSGGGNTWIGLLIAAIIIILLAFLYFKYKKVGGGAKGPLESRVSSIERNVP